MNFVQRVHRAAANRPRVTANELFRQVSDEMLDVYSRWATTEGHAEIDRMRSVLQRRTPAEFARVIAQTLFDCELLVVSEP